MAIEWRKISSGNEGIDNAHKQLMELALAIDAACDASDFDAVSNDSMQGFLELTNAIFELEEAAMEELGYTRTTEHVEEHEILISTIESAINKVKSRSPALIKDAVGMMLFSLNGHVETMDVPLTDQISKKIRSRPFLVRRNAEAANGPAGSSARSCQGAAGRRGGSSPPATPQAASGGGGGDAGDSLKSLIVSSYAATLLNLKSSKGLTGDGAKNVAYEVVARAINKTTGKKISAEFVKQILVS